MREMPRYSMCVSLRTALCLLLALAVLIFEIHQRLRQEEDPQLAVRLRRLPHPLWSWDFATQCCEVHPDGEKDTSYLHADLTNGSAVYVKVTQLTDFVEKFLLLPSTHRISLVTGMDDFGPVELFSERCRIGNGLHGKLTLEQFLNDERLVVWYAQNYDVGCSPITGICTPVDLYDKPVLRKLQPLPLGIDLHTWAEKRNMTSTKFKKLVARQRLDLSSAANASAAFLKKRTSMVVSFGCTFKQDQVRMQTRGVLCSLLNEFKDKNWIVPTALKGEQGRRDFWHALQGNAFAIAPFGRGLDTHRLWETLHLRSVPIVLSSPLDAMLESLFPVVIVKRWRDAFDHSFLLSHKRRLAEKFGFDKEGRLGADGLPLLLRQPWVDLVRSSIDSRVPVPSWYPALRAAVAYASIVHYPTPLPTHQPNLNATAAAPK